MAGESWQEAWVEVLPDLSEFRTRANREMSDALGSAGTAGGLLAGKNISGGVLGSIRGMAGPLLGAIAALGIGRAVGEAIGSGIRYGLDAVPLASDLAETRSAIDQVFGEAGKDIQAFAEGANRRLGQTRVQALQAAQTFGVFARAADLTGDPLANFSTGLVTLSTDLASFYNSSPQEAIDAIGAGLRGEAEPLRRYGVLLDDATLKQRAITLGIYDGNGALTSQQRILAAQAEIYAQTGIAQGDFERTSAGLAGQQKILEASLQDVQTSLGEALLPAFTELATFANDTLVPKLDSVIDRIGPKLGEAIENITPKLEGLIDKIVPLIDFTVDEGLPFVIDQLDRELSDKGLIGGLPTTMNQLDMFFNDYLPRWASGSVEVEESWDGFFNWWDIAWDGTADTVQNKSDEIKAYWSGTVYDMKAAVYAAGMETAGWEFAQGFADGIETGTESAVLAAERMALAARRKVNDTMEIRSPSRAMRRDGMHVPEGWALGILDGIPLIESAADSMAAAAMGVGSRDSLVDVASSAAAQAVARDSTLATMTQAIAPASSGMPSTLTVVDADGALIGRMRIEAQSEAQGAVRAYDDDRYQRSRGGVYSR